MKLGVGRLDWDPTLERLIGVVRLALAAFALFIIWVDPTQPSKHVAIAYSAFIVYLVYSAAAFQLVRTRPRPWLLVTTQIIDLLWIPPVLLFTEAGNTPFFPFFVVIMLTAGIRWGIWASWAVTAYSLVMYGFLLFVEPPTPLDMNNDLMQLSYFLIVGILGGYLAEYRRRREAELRTLRATSEAVGTKYTAAAAMVVVVDAARTDKLADAVVGVLREPETGDVLMVRGSGDTKRLSPEEAAPFFAAAAGHSLQEGIRGIRLADHDDVILRFADADRGLAYPIRAGDELVGAIFFFFRASRSGKQAADELPNLLLRHVIPQIETLYILEQAPRARVLEERRRIARDLHDSFIQVLAALGLRLDVLCASTSATPAAIEQERRELAQIREIIGREQRRVRAYIAEMREPLRGPEGLREIVERAAEAFHARTQIPVDVSVRGNLAELPGEVVRELAPLLGEALTNVEKHARASNVTVAARMEDRELILVVSDDGLGMNPTAAPAARAVAPRGHGLSSMRERAQLLGGTLSVAPSATTGTVVTVTIPLPAFV
jgi:signal transduction histidine kinase